MILINGLRLNPNLDNDINLQKFKGLIAKKRSNKCKLPIVL
jgi:hypothetical protein